MATEYDLKKSLPNKMVNENNTITDLAGNPVTNAVTEYENKPALPNKWLNPDGTYSTLAEILSGMIDTDLFIVVEELPASGNVNKIYLLTVDDKLEEYHWTGTKWDPIGMVEFDISKYSTTEQMNAAILAALNTAKAYADTLFGNIPPEIIYYDGEKTNYEFWNNLITKTNPVLIYMFGNSYAAHIPNPSKIPETAASRKVEFVAPKLYTRDSGGYTYISQQMWTYNLVFENGEVVAIGTSYDQIMLNTIDPTKTYGSAFSPTKAYHPATKKYVDDSIATNITNVLGGSY